MLGFVVSASKEYWYSSIKRLASLCPDSKAPWVVE